MFDTKYYRTQSSHYHHHSVTEKRAPTDESVRLLREMETAAKKQVEKSISIPLNEFKGVIHLRKEILSCATFVKVIYNLNGVNHTVDIKLDDFYDNKDQRMKKIMQAVSDDFSVNTLRNMWNADITKALCYES